MSLTAGIVGLPNVGKSTLFNAITNSQVEAANYPFATIAPNVGVVEVIDQRVDKIAEFIKPKKTVYTTIEFTDIAGLVKGASKGEGLGNQFLSHIREVDAICHVVRCFDDDNIEHVEVGVDPIRDIEIINLELIFADLATLENRLARIDRKIKASDKSALFEANILKKVQAALLDGKPARSVNLAANEIGIVKGFHLLTSKPVLYVANIAEEELSYFKENQYYQLVKEFANKENNQVIAISAKIEEELSELDKEEKEMFFKDLGIEVSGLDMVIQAVYKLLGLSTFFTAGEEQARAWAFTNGMKAPECAGKIHTDFERGFIKAETYSYNDLLEYESEKAIKDAGKMRLEGKEYLVQDGDIIHFRFNV